MSTHEENLAEGRFPAPDSPLPTRLRPAGFCHELLATIEAAEGRRKRRSRNTTADAIGLDIRRQLLEEVCAADPEPEDFEGWLLERCLREGLGDGPVRAMALTIWDEWRLATTTAEFREWLAKGAPSDDRETTHSLRRRSHEHESR